MAGDTIKFLIEMRDGASAPLKKVGKAADQSAKHATTATTKYTELSSKLHLMGLAAKAARGVIGALLKPFRALAMGGIEAGAQMEAFETRLTTVMQDAAGAKERLDELFKIGSTTPFELPGLMEAEVRLRSLGVNSEEMLPLVMDFAGAMKVDLASAATEVGRAFQFGAGAVETMGGRTLRAQVKLAKGIDPLKMSVQEFQQAMVETLTDSKGIFAGGTDKLALTFDGMLSNLQDSFFKFKKDIGDAGLFDTAKETLRAMLEFIDQNSDGLRIMARVISDGLVNGLLGSVKLAGFLLDAFLAVNAAIVDIAKKWSEFVLKAGELVSLLKVPTLRGMVSLGPSKQEMDALKERVEVLADTKEELINMGGFATEAQDMVSKIQLRVSKLDKRRERGPGIAPGEPPKEEEEAKEEKEKSAPEIVQVDFSDELEVDLFKKGQAVKLADTIAGAMASPFSALTSMMGPAGGLVSGLASIGEMGTDKIVESFRSSIKGVIKAIFEVIPELIVELPFVILSELPMAIMNGLFKWWRQIWEAVQNFFKPRKAERDRAVARGVAPKGTPGLGLFMEFGERISAMFNPEGTGAFRGPDKKHAGTAHIDRTGAFLLQAGEQVIPNSGTTTQGMERRMGRGGGVNVTINTNVVDQNAIRGLGKLLEKEFSSFGRSTSPLFNSPTGSRG
tara:strand:- start:471 stop:2498 length:2028 start_codon:yes stop_codon:yes gene_type:complete